MTCSALITIRRPALLLVWAGLGVAVLSAPRTQSAAEDLLSQESLAMRAQLAAGYLESAQLVTGLFGYEFEFVSGRFRNADNIVRQAGATFSLAEYVRHSDNSVLANAAGAAIEALSHLSVPIDHGMVVSSTGEREEARTGTTALALLAELHYSEATDDDSHRKARLAWLRGLETLQRPTGGFARSPGSDKESNYYNGETWLALAHYQRLFPTDEIVLKMLAKAEPYLLGRYSREPTLQFAHWGLMAASVRFLQTGEERFTEFLSTQSQAVLTSLAPSSDPARNACYMVEGLAAAALALSDAGPYRELVRRINDRIGRELAKSLEMQILPGQERIYFTATRYLQDPAIASFAGAFLNGRYEPRARVDYTQHCLSAIVKFYAFKAEADGR